MVNKSAVNGLNQTDIESLTKIIKKLRGKNGCPWDKKQTPESLGIFLTEEIYELLEAIEKDNHDDVCEELGDVLFLLMFIAEIFNEKKLFSLEDVAKVNCEKMIRRHPHVFGDKTVNSSKEVITQWESIKKLEKKRDNITDSIIDSIPKKLPPLMRAYKISERTANAGFDWDDIEGVMKKVEEEWMELREALSIGDKEKISMEFGDLLFTLTNIARFADIYPDIALTSSINKFEKRYKFMENELKSVKKQLSELEREKIDSLWNRAKEED